MFSPFPSSQDITDDDFTSFMLFQTSDDEGAGNQTTTPSQPVDDPISFDVNPFQVGNPSTHVPQHLQDHTQSQIQTYDMNDFSQNTMPQHLQASQYDLPGFSNPFEPHLAMAGYGQPQRGGQMATNSNVLEGGAQTRYGYGGGFTSGYENFERMGFPPQTVEEQALASHQQPNALGNFPVPQAPQEAAAPIAAKEATKAAKGKRRKQSAKKAGTPKRSKSATSLKNSSSAKSMKNVASVHTRSVQFGSANDIMAHVVEKKRKAALSSMNVVTSESDTGLTTNDDEGRADVLLIGGIEGGEDEAEKKAQASRDRNREHARNTRLRKKIYLENLKKSVESLNQEKEEFRKASIEAVAAKEKAKLTQTHVLAHALSLWTGGSTDSNEWANWVAEVRMEEERRAASSEQRAASFIAR